MKSLGHLKSYDIQLTVQSPLFIGSGEKINKKEFIFLSNENKAIIIDLGRLVVFLNEKNLLEQYQYFLLDDKKKISVKIFLNKMILHLKTIKRFQNIQFIVLVIIFERKTMYMTCCFLKKILKMKPIFLEVA